jgi:hypothetical protein
VRCWIWIIAATWGERWGRIARIAASDTGATGPVSFAAERPLRSPLTRLRAWWTWTGSSSLSTAQPNSCRMRLTSLLISLRDRPASIIACRTFFRATGPKSTAGVVP